MNNNNEALIRLWQELNNFLNNREDNSLKAALALTTVASAFFFVNKESDLKIILYYLAPLIMLLILAYISYLFRFVAILRGYLAALEEKINDNLEESVYLWSSSYVKIFVSNNIPNALIMLCSILISVCAVVWLTVNVRNGGVQLNNIQVFENLGNDVINIINIIYFSLLSIFLIIIIVSFLDNNYILKLSYKYFKENNELKTKKDLRKIFSPKLSIRDRMKW
ncbi:MAG: hypothetical protein HFE82_04530 [Erysipelotrichaceae bacterium]|nr:hypothetical protein [Erysipelotrichaceae bacterium]